MTILCIEIIIAVVNTVREASNRAHVHGSKCSGKADAASNTPKKKKRRRRRRRRKKRKKTTVNVN